MGIKFHNINSKILLFNKLYPPTFEKDKKMELFERSTLQLLSTLIKNENAEKINSIHYNSKPNSTLKEKKIISLYAEKSTFFDY